MIRNFNTEDKKQIVDIVNQGIIMDASDLDFITDRSDKILVFDDDKAGILGFSTYRRWGKEKDKADIYTYVTPSSRRKGIGSLLYHEILKNAESKNLKYISTRIRVDNGDATPFYQRLGYEKWYVEYDFYYYGSEQPKSNLEFVQYEDKYFEQYAQGLRNSFFELRRSNDFQPYYCCELNDDKRREFLNNKENIFLLHQNEELMASVLIERTGLINDLFVLPSYQGKEYGKKTMQFAINKAIERGNKCISLNAIEWNAKALNLYRRLGFDVVQATHYYRKFIV